MNAKSVILGGAGVVGLVAFLLLTPAIEVLLLWGLGGLLLLVGLGYLQTYYTVSRSEPADLRTVNEASSAIEIAGTVQPHAETVRSPFTDTECLCCEWRVVRGEPGVTEEQRQDDRQLRRGTESDTIVHIRRRTASIVASGEDVNPFVVETDTGSVLVEPEGAQRELSESAWLRFDPGESTPEEIADFLRSQTELEPDDEQVRVYSEHRIDPGDAVHVYGPVREAGASFDLPSGTKAVIGFESPDEGTFVLGEDSFSDLVDQIRSDNRNRFVVTTGSEIEAERTLLKNGLLWSAVGLAFAGLGLFLL
ncbi:MAG: hypothetical protein BRD23_02865 [Halobacteriales archaeon SW_9_67_25]|nr:MAG: hypothetical protein BRD23_02865 [Halobacteriales archaeon SW_9_67_25]